MLCLRVNPAAQDSFHPDAIKTKAEIGVSRDQRQTRAGAFLITGCFDTELGFVH